MIFWYLYFVVLKNTEKVQKFASVISVDVYPLWSQLVPPAFESGGNVPPTSYGGAALACAVHIWLKNSPHRLVPWCAVGRPSTCDSLHLQLPRFLVLIFFHCHAQEKRDGQTSHHYFQSRQSMLGFKAWLPLTTRISAEPRSG